MVLWLRRLLLRRRPQQARQSLLATFQNTSSVITASRQADDNTFVSQIVQAVYAGDFVGSVVEHIDLGDPSRWDAQRQGSRRLHPHAHRRRPFGHDRPAVLGNR